MDFEGRLRRLQAAMVERELDLIYLPLSANLFYIAGVRRLLVHGTDHNAYGDWLCGGYITREGPIRLVAPRMGGGFFVNEVADKSWIGDVRLIREPEAPRDVLREMLTTCGITTDKARIAVDDRAWFTFLINLKAMVPEVELGSANDLIWPMRMIKDDDELAAMQKASDITDAVFAKAIAALKLGASEADVCREIDYQFQMHGAEYTSFETAVLINGERPDGSGDVIRSNLRELRPGDTIMFDFGAVVDGYCSDFGRSAVMGEPTAEYQHVHDTVLLAQAEAMRAMEAGKCTTAQANAIARKVIADAGYDAGFTHRLGHAIGVTVHEPPFLDGVDQTVMRERMMFTVEPSIIVPERFGSRVEDVVVITTDGGKPLSSVDRGLYVIG